MIRRMNKIRGNFKAAGIFRFTRKGIPANGQQEQAGESRNSNSQVCLKFSLYHYCGIFFCHHTLFIS